MNTDELLNRYEQHEQRAIYDELLDRVLDEIDTHCPDFDTTNFYDAVNRLRRDFGPKED